MEHPNTHPLDGTPLIDPALYEEHKAALATGRQGRTVFGRSCTSPEDLDLALTYRQNEIRAEAQANVVPLVNPNFLDQMFLGGQSPGAQEQQIRILVSNLQQQVNAHCKQIDALTQERDQLRQELAHRADEEAFSLKLEEQHRIMAEKLGLALAANDVLRAENERLKTQNPPSLASPAAPAESEPGRRRSTPNNAPANA